VTGHGAVWQPSRRRGFGAASRRHDGCIDPRFQPLGSFAGRFARAEKAHFYLIARGSAMECAGALDVALGRGLATAAAHRHGRGMLIRVVQMLTRLALRMQG
jgi:hypothetical protein